MDMNSPVKVKENPPLTMSAIDKVMPDDWRKRPVYDYAGAPWNYIMPGLALSIESITDHTGTWGDYPISGDNIARVRAGVR